MRLYAVLWLLLLVQAMADRDAMRVTTYRRHPEHWMSTYETEMPWCVYHYGLTHDKWWPFWNSTRVLGRARMLLECAVCGQTRKVAFKIPRFGPIPDRGRHPERVKFMLDHLHPDRGHPMSWALPLLNPTAHNGIDLDLLAMRLQAELNDQGAARGETRQP